MMIEMKNQVSKTQLCVATFALAILCAVAPHSMAEDGSADHSDHSDHAEDSDGTGSESHAGHSGPSAHAPIGGSARATARTLVSAVG